VTSLNAPKPGRESGEWQENLSENVDESLLDELIACEESETRQTQKTQLNTVLTEALGQLDSQAQTLLELYYQNGLTQKEIAQQLETKQYAISRRLTKTRESLLLTLAKWSQETLHISLNSNVLGDISTVLEEWLQSYYNSSEPHS
jgi:DNA-directed RNA polymerase specialized sigma24 family protein